MTKFLLVLSLVLSAAPAFADEIKTPLRLYTQELDPPYGNDWFVAFTYVDGYNRAIITGIGKTADFIGIYTFTCTADRYGQFVRKWDYAMNFGAVDSAIVPQEAIDKAIVLGCK